MGSSGAKLSEGAELRRGAALQLARERLQGSLKRRGERGPRELNAFKQLTPSALDTLLTPAQDSMSL